MIFRCLLAIILAAWIHPARSESPPLPIKPDRPGLWRVMTYFDFTTKWYCPKRQPHIPICAIELAQACEARGDLELCKRVWDWARETDASTKGMGDPSGHIRYRIEKARWITQADHDRLRERDRARIRVGDLLVTIRQLSCMTMTSGCPHERYASKEAYILRRIDGSWEVTQWDERFYGYE